MEKREEKSMTRDTEAEVARVNRGMSIRRSKKKNSLLNDARIKARISRCDNGTRVHTHSVSTCRRPLRWIETAVRSRTSMMMTTRSRGGQRRQWRRPAVSGYLISGSLRSLHDSTTRHTTSVCALRTPALFQVLWFLHHKD